MDCQKLFVPVWHFIPIWCCLVFCSESAKQVTLEFNATPSLSFLFFPCHVSERTEGQHSDPQGQTCIHMQGWICVRIKTDFFLVATWRIYPHSNVALKESALETPNCQACHGKFFCFFVFFLMLLLKLRWYIARSFSLSTYCCWSILHVSTWTSSACVELSADLIGVQWLMWSWHKQPSVAWKTEFLDIFGMFISGKIRK